ncbi:MAG: pilus assembly protein PilM, partial [Lachnospiraceae bacterium]
MIAIEVTAKSLQIVSLVESNHGASVKKCVSVPIPVGMVKNGYIDSLPSLAEHIQTALFENGIKEKKISFTIDTTAIKTKQVEVPFDTREHVLQFMKKAMGELITDEEHMMDYITHYIRKEKKRKYINATIYAIPRSMVQRYIDLAKELKLAVWRIDILNDAMAKQIEQRNPVKKVSAKKNKEAEQQVGAQKIWVGIYYERLKIITQSAEGALSNRTIMIGFDAGMFSGDVEQEQKLITRYVDEIRKHNMIQENASGGDPVESIELFGEHPMLSQMRELVQKITEIDTRLMEKPKQIKGISQEEYPRFAGAIGSSIR